MPVRPPAGLPVPGRATGRPALGRPELPALGLDPTRDEPTRDDPGREVPVRVELVRDEPARDEPAPEEPTREEPARLLALGPPRSADELELLPVRLAPKLGFELDRAPVVLFTGRADPLRTGMI